MKKAIFSVIFAFIFSSVSLAYGLGFRAQAHISVQRNVVTATVVNNFAYPVVCSGRVFGRTYFGNTFYSYMNSVVIFPGQWSNIYVYTNYNDWFVNGWSDVWCRRY